MHSARLPGNPQPLTQTPLSRTLTENSSAPIALSKSYTQRHTPVIDPTLVNIVCQAQLDLYTVLTHIEM